MHFENSVPHQRCSVKMCHQGFWPSFKLQKKWCSTKVLINKSEVYSEPSQTSKMELFPKIFILDDWLSSKCTSEAGNNKLPHPMSPSMFMLPSHHTSCPSSATNAPPSPLSARCAKYGFAIWKLLTVFGKLQIEITKENCETTLFDDQFFLFFVDQACK